MKHSNTNTSGKRPRKMRFHGRFIKASEQFKEVSDEELQIRNKKIDSYMKQGDYNSLVDTLTLFNESVVPA